MLIAALRSHPHKEAGTLISIALCMPNTIASLQHLMRLSYHSSCPPHCWLTESSASGHQMERHQSSALACFSVKLNLWEAPWYMGGIQVPQECIFGVARGPQYPEVISYGTRTLAKGDLHLLSGSSQARNTMPSP